MSRHRIIKILSIVLVSCLLTGCAILDFDKNKNTYITEPEQMDGLDN